MTKRKNMMIFFMKVNSKLLKWPKVAKPLMFILRRIEALS